MFWFIALTFPLNFALGAAIALLVHRRLSAPPKAPQPPDIAELQEPPTDDSCPPPDDKPADAAPAGPRLAEEIPAAWLELLQRRSITSQSFVEASVQVLRLEVWRYRQQLVAIEDRVRDCTSQPEANSIRDLLAELREVNADWLATQAAAARHLAERQGRLSHFEDLGAKLERVLLDQQVQIEAAENNLRLLESEGDSPPDGTRLLLEIARLIDLAHALRDRMHESLVTILRADRRLDDVERRMQRDSLTNLLNRTGVEVALHEWWRDDIARQRLVSVVLVDFDGCGELNERLGTRHCDRLLAAFARLLDDLAPKDHGYHRAARFEGQTFAVFCGDTGPRHAMALAERIRQTIAATTFGLGEDEVDLSVSCAVTEIQKDDTPDKLYKRLRQALRAAKASGGNCTTLDEGHGAVTVEPPQYQVHGRLVRVGEEATEDPVEEAAALA